MAFFGLANDSDMRYNVALAMPVTDSLELKGIVREYQKHGLYYSFCVIPTSYPFGSRKDYSHGQCK
jgi:hypothetical protein